MNATRVGAVLLLFISIGWHRQQTRTSAASISRSSSSSTYSRAGTAGLGVLAAPGQTPVYRIKLRVHNGQTTLPVAELRKSLEEMNYIWWSQAGVCFEITSTKDDATAPEGFDIWFV